MIMKLSFRSSKSRVAAIFLASVPLALIFSGCGKSSEATPTSSAPVAESAPGAFSLAPAKTFTGQGDMILSLAFSRDGKTLASASADRTVQLWDVESGKVLQTLTGNRLIVWSADISPEGKTVASGGNDGSLRIWDAQSGQASHVITQGPVVNTVAFSPDGKLIASGRRTANRTRDASLNLWDAASGKLVHAFTSAPPFPTQGVTFSPDGKLLLSGGLDKMLRLWDVQTGKLQRTFVVKSYIDNPKGQNGVIYRVAFSPDGSLIASGGYDEVGTVWVWGVKTGALLHTLKGTKGGVSGLAFSPDGKTLASGTRNQVQIWDAQSGKLQKSWDETSTLGVKSLAFTPDGKFLVTGSAQDTQGNRQGTIHFWPLS